MHPHILFKSDNYSHSIYVDSNIFITRNDFFDYVYRLIKIKSIIALINHPYRYCCYQELETVYANKLISTKEFINTKEFLNKNFHNKNKGLYEANLIFRNHNDKTIQEFNTDWWQGFSTICPRDQVFLPYFLKNHSLNPDLFFNTPLINVRNSPSTIFLLHKKNQLRCKTNQKLLAENYKIYYYNVIPVKNLPENQLLKHLGYDAQLDSPRTFNEHICSLKILKSTSLQTKLSDNLGAKEYIKTLPYPINSTDVLGIGNSFSDLLSQNLPNSFFIKTSHTNQSWLIENRTSVPNSLINEINSSLEMINGTKTFESNYLNIPRLLFAEENIELPALSYNIFVFNGTPKLIKMDINQDGEQKCAFYTTNWKKQPFGLKHPIYAGNLDRPKELDLMLDISTFIGKKHKFIQINFTIRECGLYIDKFVLYPGAGLDPFSEIRYDFLVGQYFLKEKI